MTVSVPAFSHLIGRSVFLAVLLTCCSAASAFAQGQPIRVNDGDTIVVHGDAHVNIVRTRSAHIRAVSQPNERWLIVLARFTDRPTSGSGVDEAWLFRDVEGTWPLGARWEGEATVETYSAAGESGGPGPGGFGLRVPVGLIQIFRKDSRRFAASDSTAIMEYRGFGRSAVRGAPFDDVERTTIAEARTQSSNGGVRGSVSINVMPNGVALPMPAADAPRKIHDVAPVWPEAARHANVRGMVIVEVTIGTDGGVTEAGILRGIPLLNDAALACVRQWRYEPVLVNGRPVSVRITATVSFP